MKPSDLQKRRADAFLIIANRELDAARRLGQEFPEQAAYFLQQTVEKLIRALLEAEGIPAGVSHNLRTLAAMLPNEHLYSRSFEQFDDMSSASTRFRYPTSEGRVPSFDPKRLSSTIEAIDKITGGITTYVQKKFSQS